MPARTVVLEKLDKWNGEAHVALTPGEYTQLTGRAGRRGIDVEGHAVVLWQPGLDPGAVAGLASTRTYPLNSSFRPSYNMAVNLTGRVGRQRAAALLESSFAQFQADRGVVGLARRLRRVKEAADDLARQVSCDRGDFMEYAALRRRLTDEERGASTEPRRRPARAGPPGPRHPPPGRHHPRPVRPPGRLRGGAQPAAGRGRVLAQPRRRPARADRARPAQAAVRGRLPGSGRAGRAPADPELVQRALTQAPPRSRLLDALQDRGPRSGSVAAAAAAGRRLVPIEDDPERSRVLRRHAGHDSPPAASRRRPGRAARRRRHRRAAPHAPPPPLPRAAPTASSTPGRASATSASRRRSTTSSGRSTAART